MDTIEVPVWWRVGNGMVYRRDALPKDHPESTYRYLRDKLGVVPEDYGVGVCACCGQRIRKEEEADRG